MVLTRGKEKTLESIREARGAPEEGRARIMSSDESRRGSGGGGASSLPVELLARCAIDDRKQDERMPLPTERKLDERRLEERKQSSAAASSGRKIVVKSADMKESMQNDAIACALAAFENRGVEKDIAEYIKKEFDKNHGPTWHCIVGRNFGSYVTHETNHFIYFYMDQKAILLFKSG